MAQGNSAEPCGLGTDGVDRAATQFVTMIGFGLSMPFIPLYVQALGVTERAEVALWSGRPRRLSRACARRYGPDLGALSDRYGRKSMLVRSMLGGAVVISLMGFVENVWQLLGLRLIQGAVTGSQAAAAALVAASSRPARPVSRLGLIATAVQVGNTVGPAIGGVAVGPLGFRGSFLVAGVLLLIAGLMAIFWIEEPSHVKARARPAASKATSCPAR